MTDVRVIQVCAALIMRGERILVAKRKSQLQQGDLWEFPGGKLEAGESPQQCLARELMEELGIRAGIGEFFADTTYAYPDCTIRLSAYWASNSANEDGSDPGPPVIDNLQLTDHSEVRWVTVLELQGLALAPADIPIADKLLSLNPI